MATQSMVIDGTVQDVTAELSLARGSTYTLQNLGVRPIRLSERAAAPAQTDPDIYLLEPKASVGYEVDNSENLYAWTATAEGTRLSSTAS